VKKRKKRELFLSPVQEKRRVVGYEKEGTASALKPFRSRPCSQKGGKETDLRLVIKGRLWRKEGDPSEKGWVKEKRIPASEKELGPHLSSRKGGEGKRAFQERRTPGSKGEAANSLQEPCSQEKSKGRRGASRVDMGVLL